MNIFCRLFCRQQEEVEAKIVPIAEELAATFKDDSDDLTAEYSIHIREPERYEGLPRLIVTRLRDKRIAEIALGQGDVWPLFRIGIARRDD